MSVSILLTILFSVWCLSLVQGQSPGEPLFLTPLIKNGDITIARKLSQVDPALLLGIQSHSGLITVQEKYNSNLYFWYFPHKNLTSVPWIIWLNGGPGVSSLIGLFDLIGPVKLVDGKVKKRDVTWASDYSLLFIDSPVGAGFSFTQDDQGYTSNEDQVSSQLYEFMLQFLEVFPEQREAPLFIAGQSYAGKYVPALAWQIHTNNDHQPYPIKLRGISLGNPIIDPRNMMNYTELIRELGLLDGCQLEELKEIENSMIDLIDHGKMVDAANKFNETIEYIKNTTSLSIYNFLEESTHVKSSLEEFVNRPEVRSQIHVGNLTFDLNNQVVYTKMLPDIANSSRGMVEGLLSSTLYGVMCYSGQLDLILPYSNSKRVYDMMDWPLKQQYKNAKRYHVRHTTSDKVVAYKKEGGNFVDVMIRGCGHMAPKEKPEVVKQILDMFIEKFNT